MKARKPKSNPSRRRKIKRDLEENGGNPINVDDLLSPFVPQGLKQYVCDLFCYSLALLLIFLLQTEKEAISFLPAAPAGKIESAFDLHAYDAVGNKTSFKVKAHVRCL